ncbi:hypothetical protein [Blastochloris viridis]|uniref:Uncharacterized protein n=1 Tax=Blastochloris viridis TaxID=1079 RepID=A0A0H5BP09_BLAVI|nr:hypothetical protein [Blastochloris viridis]ALK08166.1 hypothetical protein BVIR_368 [Blastochloris viridis]BAR98568.1 hypothetical protein BV133_975 [Blastochloris viridis]CUU44088.1 hypothetical protein BVIRIDIS_31350 [Blastochloris viridis]
MQHIVIMPQQHIIGMPAAIMFIMLLQHSMNISFDMPAIGIISHTMPVSVILQVMVAIIIGIMPPIIGIEFIGIMPFIIGIMGIGIMLLVIGIVAAVAVMVLSRSFG